MIKNHARWFGAALLAVGCREAPPRTELQGVIELDERVLAFEEPGRVDAIAVRRGDAVADGGLIAKLDDTLERLVRDSRVDDATAAAADLALLKAGAKTQDVASLAADVQATAAAEELARKTLERTRQLRERDAVAQADVDRAQADLDRVSEQRRAAEQRLGSLRAGARPQEIARAAARADAARTAVAVEEARLARHELRTKVAGTIVDIHVDPGELAAIGTPVATVADVTHAYVDVFVPQAEIGALHVGTTAEIRADGVAPVGGQIEHISPRTEFTPRFLFSPQERPHLVIRVRVRANDPRQALHAGAPAFVRFVP